MNARVGDTPPKESVRILLNEIIDYAGLFPPSQVSMSEAVLNYATYRHSNYGWMLGRFILPVSRLDEFYESAREFLPKGREAAWKLSVLAGEDVQATIRSMNEFNRKNSDRAVCEVLEVKAATVSKIENTMTSLPKAITPYFEIAPVGRTFVDLIATLGIKKLRAKIRTGGVTREEFPDTRDIIRFVRTCMAANVPFKATAGLHHPIRCFKPLTYAPQAPQGTMHGFLNVLIMTGFARESFRVSLLEEIMEEEFEEVFEFAEAGVSWRGSHILTLSHIDRLRSRGMHSFGSCSFDEPVADLRELGVL
ncbi:MAG TPA: hypothetical protein VMZ26_04530 [Pyrinomonadaceae bacterium]|nr:hypothetical protein [Pyrinomonadaceae bacterium]